MHCEKGHIRTPKYLRFELNSFVQNFNDISLITDRQRGNGITKTRLFNVLINMEILMIVMSDVVFVKTKVDAAMI